MSIAGAERGAIRAGALTLALAAALVAPIGAGATSAGPAEPGTDRFIVRYRGDGGIGGGAVTVATARERTAGLGQTLGLKLAYAREMSAGLHVISLPRARADRAGRGDRASGAVQRRRPGRRERLA